MSDKLDQDKPSMEDILVSIRRIIADDAQTRTMGTSEANAEVPGKNLGGEAGLGKSLDFNINEDSLQESKRIKTKPDGEILELTEEVDAEGNLLLGKPIFLIKKIIYQI